ncbi:TetR family transcriptional regulator [Sphingobacterium sp. SRCM116780]|uniref:TetR/AcrR family transcriptional regulator n=1 Tax=Sphingobacterium sp. SRCM116780 TaxID=2907623 RepID=UPI001F1E71B7|nr:TetR family transcriptional regulator [Sphingobacterium sp. SRCM116780]UIR57128.1 TetR family transcriptional regulator [Sphingobacterium sp. SRCM116780]
MEFNEKQLEILHVAEELFSQNGFDGTSVRDIANQAQVNVAMINYYFGSKDKLLDDLFAYRIEKFKMDDRILKLPISVMEMLDEMVNSYITCMNSSLAIYQIIAIEAGVKKRLLLSDSYKSLKEHNLRVISEIIQKGIAGGEFREGNDPVLIHATMMGTFMNFQMNKTFLKSELKITSDDVYTQYMESTLITHLQRTIKALLTYEY